MSTNFKELAYKVSFTEIFSAPVISLAKDTQTRNVTNIIFHAFTFFTH